MTSGQTRFPDRAVEVQVRPARPVRHVGQRAAAAHGQDGRRHVLHPQHAHRGDQPRAGDHLHADRQPDHRPALPRLLGVATAWARSTRTCRPSWCWSPGRPTPSRCRRSRRRLWSSGLPAGRACRRDLPQRAATRSCTSTIRPACPPRSAASTLDGLQALNEMDARRRSAIPRRAPGSQQYEMAFRMQASVPELTDLASEPASHLRALRRGGEEARARSPTRRSGPADGRARRALRADLPQQLGHARQRGRPAAEPVQGRRPGLLGPRPGPQAAAACFDETLVIWGGEFGRTIYSQGGLSTGELRPRPPPALLHDVDGRRRLPAGHDLRRDRRLLLQHRQGSGARPRLPRHGAAPARASTTSGSPTATRASTSG